MTRFISEDLIQRAILKPGDPPPHNGYVATENGIEVYQGGILVDIRPLIKDRP